MDTATTFIYDTVQHNIILCVLHLIGGSYNNEPWPLYKKRNIMYLVEAKLLCNKILVKFLMSQYMYRILQYIEIHPVHRSVGNRSEHQNSHPHFCFKVRNYFRCVPCNALKKTKCIEGLIFPVLPWLDPYSYMVTIISSDPYRFDHHDRGIYVLYNHYVSLERSRHLVR